MEAILTLMEVKEAKAIQILVDKAIKRTSTNIIELKNLSLCDMSMENSKSTKHLLIYISESFS